MDPKDPNFIRDSKPDSTGFRLLDHETVTQLDQLRRTLQIIVAGLLMGVVAFGGFVIVNGEGPRSFFGPDRMDFMLVMAAACAVASLVVPPLLGRSVANSASNAQPAMKSLLNGDPDHDRAIHEAQRIQATTIVGCALLEAGAFGNLFALMQSEDDVHSCVAIVMLLGMVLRFPLRSRYLRRIEFAVEEARLEQPLSK